MNKEHFLIELKICLKPLSIQDQAIILDKYNTLFEERIAAGETEEQIAKSLAKPRAIAQEILEEYHVEIPDRPTETDGWQEIQAEVPLDDFEEEDSFSTPYATQQRYYERPYHSPVARFFQVAGILCLNFLFMFWILLGIFMTFVGLAIAGAATLLSPILGIYGLLVQYGDATLFQFSASLFLFGASIVGWLIFIPIVKLSYRLFRQYFQWNIAVLRGDI